MVYPKNKNKTIGKEAVPKGLRQWFIIHFIVDIAVAIPLFLMPEVVLSCFRWESIDPVSTRLFAAALFAIGIKSYLVRNAGVEVYSSMLNLKILWSTFAALGLLVSIMQGIEDQSLLPWIGLLVFAAFNLLWLYWKYRLNQISEKI